MLARKHGSMLRNTSACQQMGSGLKFFVNSELKWFKQREKKRKKISGYIFLCMKATIPAHMVVKKTNSEGTLSDKDPFRNQGLTSNLSINLTRMPLT
jgi:hypothetical protein